MAVFSRIKTWVSNEVLTAADLNAEFNNILNNMKPEGIEDASATVADMQSSVNPGGVGTESLATDLLGEIKRLRYVVQRLVGTYWYSNPGRYLTAGGLNVQTADIAAGAVTQAKRAALGQQVSGAVSFSTSSTSFVDATSLSVSITTTGRPVFVGLIAVDSDSVNNAIYATAGGGVARDNAGMRIAILRDFTLISSSGLVVTHPTSSVNTTAIQVPPSSLYTIDAPTAGTYTYKIQVRAFFADMVVGVRSVKLVAYEL